MIKDITSVENADREYTYLFNYQGVWMTDKQLVRITKHLWTNVKTSATKYRILGNRSRWIEVPFAAEGDAVGEFGNYLITSNGVVLTKDYFNALGVNMLSVRLTVDGNRGTYYISDLLYHAFINKDYNPADRNTWMRGNFYENAKTNTIDLDSIELKKDSEKDLKKKKDEEEVHSTSPQKVKSKPNFSTISGETYSASTSSSVNKTTALLFGDDKH